MQVFPAVCFPSVAYLQHLYRASDAVIDLGENFVKQSYRNRFDVLGPNGRMAITARVVGHSGSIPINQVQLVNDEWRRLARKGIQAAYGRSAFFIHYYDEMEALINDAASLAEFNLGSTTLLLEQWGMKLPKVSESYIEDKIDQDYRNRKAELSLLSAKNYPQVFQDRFPFEKNLSGIDLLMNLGPAGIEVIASAERGA